MIDYRNLQILHPHGDEWVEMHHEHHDVAEHDPERQWGRGAKIFRCKSCEEQVVVVPQQSDVAEPES